MVSALEAQLKARFNSDASAKTDDSASSGDTYADVVALVEKVTGLEDSDISRDSELTDIGASSLNLIELTVRLEKDFGVHLDEKTALGFETVGDVVDFIDKHDEK